MNSYSSAQVSLPLVENACRGNMQAFGQLYDHYAPIVMGLVKRMVQDEKKSEQILQATFIEVWKEMRAPGFVAGRFFIRLVALARQQVLEPGNGAAVKNNMAMGNLKAIELVYFKGYSVADAARELNISLAELKTRIRTEMNVYRGMMTK